MATTPNGTATNALGTQEAGSPNSIDHDAKKVKKKMPYSQNYPPPLPPEQQQQKRTIPD